MNWRDAVEEVAKYAPAVAAGGITAGASRMVTGLLGVEDSPAGLVGAMQDTEKRAELIRINNETIRVTAILAAMAILTALASMIINYQGVPLP